jgi:hypothetical protein
MMYVCALIPLLHSSIAAFVPFHNSFPAVVLSSSRTTLSVALSLEKLQRDYLQRLIDQANIKTFPFTVGADLTKMYASFVLIVQILFLVGCYFLQLVRATAITAERRSSPIILLDQQQQPEGQRNKNNNHSTRRLQNDTACPITCNHDAICQQGNATFDSHPVSATGTDLEIHHIKNIKGYHCICPPGFTGVDCSIPFETCGDDNLTHVCYHGGTCVPGQLDELGNEQYHCDCSHASVVMDDVSGGAATTTSTPIMGSRYAGTYCENVAMEICDSGSATQTFCVNDGVCENLIGQGDAPCKCGSDFTGAHCEFSVLDDQLPDDCDLACQNGGTCQVGMPTQPTTNSTTTTTTTPTSFTYCLCPEGFHGFTCETAKQTLCGEDHICNHGSRCVKGQIEDGSDLYYCDCSSINGGTTSTTRYAGRFCQYEATDVCYNNNTDVWNTTHCVNDGTCKVNPSTSEAPCTCGELFTGAHCEYHILKDAEQIPSTCELDCKNGGSCQLGVPLQGGAAGGSNTPVSSLAYCLCPETFHGTTCQLAKSAPCGDEHICYHGSTCIQGTGDDGSDIFYCDCTTATSSTTARYAGQFCQYQATEICQDNVAFCVNDGTCRGSWSAGEAPCTCGSDFTGAHCEYHKQTDAAQLPSSCTLTCQNGGSCQFGMPLMQDDNEEDVDQTGYTTFTYCLCQEGYNGKRCEKAKSNPCGDTHICYHGGKCVEGVVEEVGGDDDFYCDCTVDDPSDTHYAGRFCEYEATEICGDNHNGVSFCVNFGTCVDDGSGYVPIVLALSFSFVIVVQCVSRRSIFRLCRTAFFPVTASRDSMVLFASSRISSRRLLGPTFLAVPMKQMSR